LGIETRRPQVLVYYDLVEGLIDEEEDLIFETKLELFPLGIINISNETISLLSIGVLEIKINIESKLEQRTLDKRTTEVVFSTIKLEDFYVKLEISLGDKVYPKTYYHHTQDDIEVDETPTKIHV
jgi:predicted NUDIX family phosphoesterase